MAAKIGKTVGKTVGKTAGTSMDGHDYLRQMRRLCIGPYRVGLRKVGDGDTAANLSNYVSPA